MNVEIDDKKQIFSAKETRCEKDGSAESDLSNHPLIVEALKNVNITSNKSILFERMPLKRRIFHTYRKKAHPLKKEVKPVVEVEDWKNDENKVEIGEHENEKDKKDVSKVECEENNMSDDSKDVKNVPNYLYFDSDKEDEKEADPDNFINNLVSSILSEDYCKEQSQVITNRT
ncbi:uncharacterized protein LOC141611974 isoform X2 [Silene latifolia]|uniref:uncharacterized protein LOC141611974 isoform X2 n=1 Tax=Silene latifolia TaxID=37657 RepID=UPI003D776141